MHQPVKNAIAIGEVSVLPPLGDEVGGQGKGRVSALSLDGVRPPEALPSSKWLRYQWQLRAFQGCRLKLDSVRDTKVFIVMARLRGSGPLDLSVTVKLLAPYESYELLLKHYERFYT